MTTLQLFFIAVAWFLGGFVHGVASVGGGMVAMPIVTSFTGAREAILISCLTGLAIPLALAVLYRRHILRREVLWLTAGCIPGVPAGVALLTVLSGPVLLFGVGVMLIVFTLWQTLSHSVRTTLSFHPAAAFLTGFAGAFVTACTSLGGPILVMYAAFRGWKKEQTLASTSMFFNLMNLGLIVLQWKAGLYTADLLCAVSLSLPCAVAGVLISMPVVRVMPQKTFRKVLLLMIFVSGILLLSRAVA